MPDGDELFGVLNLCKPPQITSRDVVNQVQRLVRPARCGHAGTLDPLATGVLLVCVGAATRLMTRLQESTKVYEAEFRLGVTSNTDDITGNVELRHLTAPVPDSNQVHEALQTMVGVIEQVPPAFSAVHVAGQRAYALARRGVDVTLQPRSVRIDRITVLNYAWPVLKLEVVCGSGTYIRSLARDLGERLGCGGLMSTLQRTAIGRFHLADALDTNSLTPDSLREHLQPATVITADLPQYRCSSADRAALVCGRTLLLDRSRFTTSATGAQIEAERLMVALLDESSGRLLALAELSAAGSELQPRQVFCH